MNKPPAQQVTEQKTLESFEASTKTKNQRVSTAAYIILIFSWIFDFRSEGAAQGLAIQSVFLLTYIVSTCVFFYATRRNSAWKGDSRLFILACAIYLSFAIASGIANSQDIYQIFRNTFTVLIYLTAAYATVKMAVFCQPHRLRTILTSAAFGYAISSILIVYIFQGSIDLQVVRYEILGASSIAVLGLVIIAIITNPKPLEVLSAVSGIAVIALTVTRTYILIFASQLLLLIPSVRPSIWIRVLGICAGLIVIGAVVTLSEPDLVERWVDRIAPAKSNGSGDATFQTRASETHYMLSEWTASLPSTLFGAGIAANTLWWVPLEVGGGQGSSIGFGHNQHVSLLFTGGIFGGLPLLIVQISQLFRAFSVFRKYSRQRKINADLKFLMLWGATIVLGTFVSNGLSSVFGSRGFSIWYGIGTGLLYGSAIRSRKMKN